RFIERIGYYNPLLPKDHADRIKLDLEKAKTWLGKGATASDRVHRFLADAGVVKPITHHNPEKMKPKKKAQERAAAAAKVAGAGNILEITSADESTELVPFTDRHVPVVDFAAGRVVVDVPPTEED